MSIPISTTNDPGTSKATLRFDMPQLKTPVAQSRIFATTILSMKPWKEDTLRSPSNIEENKGQRGSYALSQ